MAGGFADPGPGDPGTPSGIQARPGGSRPPLLRDPGPARGIPASPPQGSRPGGSRPPLLRDPGPRPPRGAPQASASPQGCPGVPSRPPRGRGPGPVPRSPHGSAAPNNERRPCGDPAGSALPQNPATICPLIGSRQPRVCPLVAFRCVPLA